MDNIPTGFFCFPPAHWPTGWKLAYQILAEPVCLIHRLGGRLRAETHTKSEPARFWVSKLLSYTRHVYECLGKIEEAVPVLDSVGAYRTLDVAYQIQKEVQPMLSALGQARCIPIDPSNEQTRLITQFRDQWLAICEKFPERLLLERLRTQTAKEIGLELETVLLDVDKPTCHMGIALPAIAKRIPSTAAPNESPSIDLKSPSPADSARAQDDPTAYRPASEFIDDERFPNFKAIQKALKANPSIRSRRPKGKNGEPIPNRLQIHAGDWNAFKNRNASDALDLPAAVVEAVLDTERRKQEIREQRGGK